MSLFETCEVIASSIWPHNSNLSGVKFVLMRRPLRTCLRPGDEAALNRLQKLGVLSIYERGFDLYKPSAIVEASDTEEFGLRSRHKHALLALAL